MIPAERVWRRRDFKKEARGFIVTNPISVKNMNMLLHFNEAVCLFSKLSANKQTFLIFSWLRHYNLKSGWLKLLKLKDNSPKWFQWVKILLMRRQRWNQTEISLLKWRTEKIMSHFNGFNTFKQVCLKGKINESFFTVSLSLILTPKSREPGCRLFISSLTVMSELQRANRPPPTQEQRWNTMRIFYRFCSSLSSKLNISF